MRAHYVYLPPKLRCEAVRAGSNFRLIDNDILATWAGLATGSHGVLSNGQDLGHFGVQQLLILSRFTLVPSC